MVVEEILTRIFKYLLEGIVVALVAWAIPRNSLKFEEIMAIALVAASTFSILDVFMPAMGQGARIGTALGVGASLSGFPAGLGLAALL
jgi:hypothetical protein